MIVMKTIEEMNKETTESKEFTEYAKSQEEGALEDNDVEEIVGGIYYRPQTHADSFIPV